MEEKILFTNDTSVEVMASFAAAAREKPRKNGAMTIAAAVVMVLFACAMIYFVPLKVKFAVSFIVFIVMAAVLIGLFKGSKTVESASGLGIASTGETKSWHYDFCEESITALCGEEKTVVSYGDIESVRDIGGSFQIKHPEGRMTFKKAGFSEGGESMFRQLMKKKNITIN